VGPGANLECGALVYKYFDGGLGKNLRIGLLEIECESDFSRFCTDFSEFLGLGPRKILRIRPFQIECESNLSKTKYLSECCGTWCHNFF